jgi:6-pyruvoyltetrahydropterin/6-carboxytetrahydropterin synthase
MSGMLELSRTVRFCVAEDGTLATDAPVTNSFAAWPPMRGLGRYYEIEVTCRGEADRVTGYFMNIKVIDQAVRSAALPLVAAAVQGRLAVGVGGLVREMIQALRGPLDGTVASVCLRLSPYYSVTIEESDMSSVLVSHQYEFSAAHRLHCDQLSEAANRETFGKCNNPAGHGHNYKVEVTVRSPLEPSGDGVAIEKLDDLVEREAINRLDHKNLTVDVPEFRGGRNSSVENIAEVVWGYLKAPVKTLGVELVEVRVWETSKTVCTYRG